MKFQMQRHACNIVMHETNDGDDVDAFEVTPTEEAYRELQTAFDCSHSRKPNDMEIAPDKKGVIGRNRSAGLI